MADYAVTPDSELPRFIPGETPIDSYWAGVGKLCNRITGDTRFPVLFRLSGTMLTIPNCRVRKNIFYVLSPLLQD